LNTSFALLLLSLHASVVSEVATPTPTASKASTEVDRVVLEVDHGPLLEQQKVAAAEKSGFFVRDDATRALRERHHVEVVEDAAAPAILVKLAWKDYDNSVYAIEISTRRPGEAKKLVEALEATCINNSALVEVVLANLPAALEQLERPQEAAPVPEVSAPEPQPEGPDPVQQPTKIEPADKPAALGAVGIVGIVAGVGGLGMAGFGISRLVKGETRMIDPEREQFGIANDARPQGRAWLGVGMGAAVVGATMLVVDLTVLRKRRARSVAIVPALGLGTVGIDLRGRF
jgi:hypothetical protein